MLSGEGHFVERCEGEAGRVGKQSFGRSCLDAPHRRDEKIVHAMLLAVATGTGTGY